MNQFVRLFEIDKRIRAEQYPNADSLAADLEVTSRLIYLDRTKLMKMGAPIQWNTERGGWYYGDKTWTLTTAWLSENELLAFFLSVEIARSSGNAGLATALESAVNKLTGSLGEIVSVDVNALRASTSYAPSPAATVNATVYLDLHRAAASRHKVKMRYFTASRGKISVRVVEPYHLHFVRGEWYLIARDEHRDLLRNFNIARISELERLDTRFERQSDFDATDYVRQMFCAEAGDEPFAIAIRFDEYQARYIRERQWHREQTIEDLEDGGLILRFEASGLNEVARWVMGYGCHAQVLEPPQLFSIVVSHLHQMLRIYDEGAA